MKNLTLLVVLLGTLALTACEDEAPPAAPPPLPSSVQDLTAGDTKTWRLSYVVQNNDTTVVNAADCRTDERLTFTYTGYRFRLEQGPVLCNSLQPDTLGGTWSYTNSGQFLELRDSTQGLVLTYNVVERNINLLRLSLPGAVLEAWQPVE
jgi:hypothetical protein